MSVVVVDRGRVAASDPTTRAHREPLVAPACLKTGALAIVVVLCGLLAVSAPVRHNMLWTGDAPFFHAIARHPFGSGGWLHPEKFGDAYRYGRILFPFGAWALALGRPAWVGGSLVVVYVVSFGAWVALAAEHLRRNGRRPALALWIFAFPFSILAFFRPEAVSDPMAGALLFLVYLYEREGRTRAACIAGALLVLTREPMALALVPLMWTAGRSRGWRGVRMWAAALVPYAAWTVWLRVHVGQFPFTDPSVSRRQALAGPFGGYAQMLREGTDLSQKLGMIVAAATLAAVVIVAVVMRGRWHYPLTHGAVALAVVIPFLGIAVFEHPIEAFRVVVPLQALLLVIALDRREAVIA